MEECWQPRSDRATGRARTAPLRPVFESSAACSIGWSYARRGRGRSSAGPCAGSSTARPRAGISARGAGSVDHLAPLAAALLHVKPAPERALEVGTGTGEGALLIAREFPQARVRGVDISEEMIRGAKRKVGLDPEGPDRLPGRRRGRPALRGRVLRPRRASQHAAVHRRGGARAAARRPGRSSPPAGAARRPSTRQRRRSMGVREARDRARRGRRGRGGHLLGRAASARPRIDSAMSPTGGTSCSSTRRPVAAAPATCCPSSREPSATRARRTGSS